MGLCEEPDRQTQVFRFSQMLEQLTARDWQGEGSLFHPKISCVGRWERPRGLWVVAEQ